MVKDLPLAVDVQRDRRSQPRHFAPKVAAPERVMATRDTPWAGGSAGGVVDHEVVSVELVGFQLGVAAQWDRLDRSGVASGVERGADLAGSVGGVGQDLQAGVFIGEQFDAGGAVTGVGRGQGGGGDKAGVGLDGNVSLVAVSVGADALVHVPAVGIDHRDHPIGGDPLSDPPRPVLVARFDVLAGDQRQQARPRRAWISSSSTPSRASMIARASFTSPETNAAFVSESSHADTGLPAACRSHEQSR